MEFRISKRVSSQISSPLTQLFELRDRYLRSPDAIELIDASQGVPNYPPPKVVKDAIEQASHSSETYKYSDRRGILDLREAIRLDFQNRDSFIANVEDILVTSGCNAAFCVTASALLDPGDQAIVPLPYYFNHPMWLEMLGAEVVEANSNANGTPDLDHIFDLITPLTRVVVLVSPGNPTGATIPAKELEEFTDRVGEAGIYVILDETYRAFSDHDKDPFVGSSFDRHPNLIRLLSFSKELAIPGLRVGAACANSAIVPELLKVHDCFSICPSRIGQLAAVEGLTHGTPWKLEQVLNVRKRRSRFLRLVSSSSSGFEISAIGGFFAWLRHPFVGLSSWEAAEKLLAEAGLLTLPGGLFGRGQESHIRVGLAGLSFDEIEMFAHRCKGLG